MNPDNADEIIYPIKKAPVGKIIKVTKSAIIPETIPDIGPYKNPIKSTKIKVKYILLLSVIGIKNNPTIILKEVNIDTITILFIFFNSLKDSFQNVGENRDKYIVLFIKKDLLRDPQ